MKIGYFLNSLFRSKRVNFDKKLKILVKTIVLIVRNELFETAKTRQNAKLSHLLIPSTEKAKKTPPKFYEKCMKEKGTETIPAGGRKTLLTCGFT